MFRTGSGIARILILLPLLRPLQVHLNRRAALRTLDELVSLHWLRLGERHVELVGLILGMPAARALDCSRTTTGIRLSSEALRRGMSSSSWRVRAKR